MSQFKIVIARHPDGYIAYPLGLNGAVIGQGDTYDEALADVTSAIRLHIETFGPDAFDPDSPILDAHERASHPSCLSRADLSPS